ncbi:hypothetical protein [Bifidobacterium eulemuris]|uniref:hypothetical protein n=1 Tax=Bifidobacterium eulemuris TaxID=1765219 RepID=UPI001B80DF44|nr:hypothetical protein [Bifidobacterium eulemuris]
MSVSDRQTLVAAAVMAVAFLVLAASGVVGAADYCEASVADGSSPFTTVAQCRAYYEENEV